MLTGACGVLIASTLYMLGEKEPSLPPPSSVEQRERGEDKPPGERSVIVEGLTIVNAHGENTFSHRSPPTRASKIWRGSALIARTSSLENEVLEEKKKALLQNTLTLRLPSLPGFPEQSFPIPLSEHPEWVTAKQRCSAALGPLIPSASDDLSLCTAMIDVDVVSAFLETFLREEVAPLLPIPSHARLTALPAENSIHAEVIGKARNGWVLREIAAQLIAHALAQGRLTVTIPLEFVQGTIIPESALGISPMVLLARGQSNFAGSVPNRAHNVRKALNEYVHGVFLAPQETFSFGNLFRNSISSSNGWKMAMGIFDGSRLEATPGGGICQSSTTLYRTALLAGLPILEQHHHSMYIKFYAMHGEGLDATYYPGSKDLKFLNDTGNPILIQAYDDAEEAIVEIYGTPDGRVISLEGPYRASDAQANIAHPNGRPLGEREIAWRYRLRGGDDATEERILISRYSNAIPEEPPQDSGT